MALKHRRRRLGALEQDILERLTFGDLLYAHLLSAHSTRRFYKLARERATHRYHRRQAIERLLKTGHIRRRGAHISITKDGLDAASIAIGKTRALIGRQRWDQKWRIVAFDIPERYSALRDQLRYVLKKAGFAKLQHSVWIFPHECEELVSLIKREPHLSRYVLYGVLERIEDDVRLKKIFRISK